MKINRYLFKELDSIRQIIWDILTKINDYLVDWMANKRDDFTLKTKRLIASKVGYKCSMPNCRKPTLIPNSVHDNFLTLGDAAHISAASEGGPRYNPALTPEQRKHESNGIWLCKECAYIVDHDKEEPYNTQTLLSFKQYAEKKAKLESRNKEDNIEKIIEDIKVAMDKLGQFIEYEAAIPDPYLLHTNSDFYTYVNEGDKHSSKIRAKYIKEVSPYVENAVIEYKSFLGESDEIIKEMDNRHLPESAAVNRLCREKMYYTLQKLKTKLSIW